MKSKPGKENIGKPSLNLIRLKGWAKFFALLYRIILVVGLLLLGASAILILITRRTYLWVALIPLVMITLGIALAYVEYHLYTRLHQAQD